MSGALSGAAQRSLEALFEEAVRDRLHCTGAAPAGLEWSATAGEALPLRRVVALNMVSYRFRLVVLFEFAGDAATLALLRSPAGDGFEAEGDGCGEFANMVCGAVNRRLGSVFPHVGMSTPFELEQSCTDYLEMLAPTAVRRLALEGPDAARVRIHLCICVADGATLDFRCEAAEVAEDSTGELELF